MGISQGSEWHFSSPDAEKAMYYPSICLFDDDVMPLALGEPEQSNELTVSVKCELYKEIHGFFGTKDALIKSLALIADRVPKSYLDSLIR